MRSVCPVALCSLLLQPAFPLSLSLTLSLSLSHLFTLSLSAPSPPLSSLPSDPGSAAESHAAPLHPPRLLPEHGGGPFELPSPRVSMSLCVQNVFFAWNAPLLEADDSLAAYEPESKSSKITTSLVSTISHVSPEGSFTLLAEGRRVEPSQDTRRYSPLSTSLPLQVLREVIVKGMFINAACFDRVEYNPLSGESDPGVNVYRLVRPLPKGENVV
jgi:hypothetical protein